MPRSWIDLECPSCGEDWEADPSDLPSPDATFECRNCGEERSMAEFTKTQRSLEILKEFQ
ncbi:hypothetical protein OB920_03445 [Halobacteria archaeon HArc-gm2]|nr:hypothetical protein [Halobacteria archaeon HArc-gm2]